jgi:hypothetical protein
MEEGTGTHSRHMLPTIKSRREKPERIKLIVLPTVVHEEKK